MPSPFKEKYIVCQTKMEIHIQNTLSE